MHFAENLSNNFIRSLTSICEYLVQENWLNVLSQMHGPRSCFVKGGVSLTSNKVYSFAFMIFVTSLEDLAQFGLVGMLARSEFCLHELCCQ